MWWILISTGFLISTAGFWTGYWFGYRRGYGHALTKAVEEITSVRGATPST